MESITCELRNPLACNAFLACYNVWKQKLWFSGVVRRYKMGTLSKNWLKCDAKSKKCNCKMQNVLISKLSSRSGSVALVQMNPSLKWDHKVFYFIFVLKMWQRFQSVVGTPPISECILHPLFVVSIPMTITKNEPDQTNSNLYCAFFWRKIMLKSVERSC